MNIIFNKVFLCAVISLLFLITLQIHASASENDNHISGLKVTNYTVENPCDGTDYYQDDNDNNTIIEEVNECVVPESNTSRFNCPLFQHSSTYVYYFYEIHEFNCIHLAIPPPC